jgi:hypothetical protein
VGKSEGRSRNKGIIDYTRTSTVLTGMTSTETLLLSPALGCIRRSYRKKSIVNGTHTSAVLTTVTTSSRAPASAGGVRFSLC